MRAKIPHGESKLVRKKGEGRFLTQRRRSRQLGTARGNIGWSDDEESQRRRTPVLRREEVKRGPGRWVGERRWQKLGDDGGTAGHDGGSATSRVSARAGRERMWGRGELRGTRGLHLGTRVTWVGESWGRGRGLIVLHAMGAGTTVVGRGLV
jgi:hypothetical protein